MLEDVVGVGGGVIVSELDAVHASDDVFVHVKMSGVIVETVRVWIVFVSVMVYVSVTVCEGDRENDGESDNVSVGEKGSVAVGDSEFEAVGLDENDSDLERAAKVMVSLSVSDRC